MIHFFNSNVKVTLSNRKQLKVFIQRLFNNEQTPLGELSYVFCTDEHLLSINQQFLKHDYFTDIITFDLSGSDGVVVGEIYISIDRVKDNAQLNKTTIREELHRVVFHGALHLCGYKDKRKADKELMTQKENDYLRDYFG